MELDTEDAVAMASGLQVVRRLQEDGSKRGMRKGNA